MGYDEVGMEVPLVALAARITRWAVGGRRSHTLVYFYALRWAAMTGWSASTVRKLVATSVRTPVRPMWSCGSGLGRARRLLSVQRWNQTRVRLSTQREIGSAVTRGYFTETAWIKAKPLLQSTEMVANVSVVA